MRTFKPWMWGMGILILTVWPSMSWAAKAKDRHDCHAEKGGRYVCDKGPLAGKQFASKKAMVEALRSGSQSSGEAKPVSAKPVKAKVSKKK